MGVGMLPDMLLCNKKMNRNNILAILIIWMLVIMKKNSDIETVARTIWGEARGEGNVGMQAVANVIVNRAKQPTRYGIGLAGVCLKPKQFSCWNKDDPNYQQMLDVDDNDDDAYRTALKIAAKAVAGTLDDVTGKANHYHSVYVSPSWADPSKKTAQIGSHIFYKL